MKEAKVLHISDLHFGTGFSDAKWSQIKSLCLEGDLAPDLVIITGDVVNHPTRWRLKQAFDALRLFQSELEKKDPGKNVPFVYVPGNHDARWFGLVPLYWVTALAVLLAGFCAWVYFKYFQLDHPLVGASIFLLPTLILALRYAVFTAPKGVFKEMFLGVPTSFSEIKVGVIPLDSSEALTWGAHGTVSNDMVVPIREAVRNPEHSGIYWIAAVHHHPLPIPSDDFAERSMILKNAGTVLKNLVQNHVPLILHGHKHHQHFSRFFLAEGNNGEREITVLSAGTPTHARSPNRPHSFNFLRIKSNGTATATIYEAEQGVAFEVRKHYNISSRDFLPKRNFENAKRQAKASAQRLVNTISLDISGNASWAEEFTALSCEVALETIPYDFRVSCGTAYIATGNGHSFNGPNNRTRIQYVDQHTVIADVKLTPHLAPTMKDFGFRLEYRIQNFCALNSIQFDQMYSDSPDYSANVERLVFSVPTKIAVEQFVATIQFPEGADLPLTFWVSSSLNGEDWDEADDAKVVKVHGSRTFMLIVEGPQLGAQYKVQWTVPEVEDSSAVLRKSYQNALFGFRGANLTKVDKDALHACLQKMATAALISLLPDNDLKRMASVAVSLFGFDSDSQMLQQIAVVSDAEDEGEECFRYGLGLPGLAFKNGLPFAYDKRLNQHYRPITNPAQVPLSADFHSISNEKRTSIALPLFCDQVAADEGGTRRAYGVVKIHISGDDAAVERALSNEFARTTLGVFVTNLMQELMEVSILPSYRR